MGACGLNSLVFNGTVSGLLYLNLDWNVFRNDSMRFLVAFPTLKFLSLESSRFNRAALLEELPYMPNLEVLLLGRNKLKGQLAMKEVYGSNYARRMHLGVAREDSENGPGINQ
ncbi:receptor like protein 1, partial [Tanacetum coccineum]